MLAAKSYVPLLKTRISEVEAFQFLSVDAKQRTFPVFLLRPWPNANFLKHAVDKVLEATSGYPFALGLDIDRRNFDSTKVAQSEFNNLFNPLVGYKAYYDFLETIEQAVPVLLPTMDANNLLQQLGNANNLDRGLIVHQQRNSIIPISDAIINLPPLPHDTVFVVDAGWARDPLQMQAWAMPTTSRIITAFPTAEIVVMASSFPDSFSHIVGDFEELAHERQVYQALRQSLQGADLTYGDWGSTRLPQSGGGGRIPPRVDVAKPFSWQIFRADPHDMSCTYEDIALAAQSHSCFSEVPECWGKLQIQATDGGGGGVTGPKMNTSARINVHMTVQSGTIDPLGSDEQAYED